MESKKISRSVSQTLRRSESRLARRKELPNKMQENQATVNTNNASAIRNKQNIIKLLNAIYAALLYLKDPKKHSDEIYIQLSKFGAVLQ